MVLWSWCARAAPVVDGDVIEGEVVRLALVAGWASASDELRREVVAAAPDGVVWLGEAVHRGTPRAWAEALAGAPSGALVVLPGLGERRGDPGLRTFHQVFPDHGVSGLGVPTSWLSFTVRTAGQAWRFVAIDPRAGEAWSDEVSWLPKVAAGELPVVVLSTHLADPATPETVELEDVLHRHVDPARLALIVSGEPDAGAITWPSGAWGEGRLTVWSGAAADPNVRTTSPGWWLLTVKGTRLELARRGPGDGPSGAVWTSAEGWAN